MLDTLKHRFVSIGDVTSDYARRIGGETSALARRVGPKRGLIALGVIAAAIGSAILVRYLRLRARRARATEPSQHRREAAHLH
jgi:hypothetical protein